MFTLSNLEFLNSENVKKNYVINHWPKCEINYWPKMNVFHTWANNTGYTSELL